MPRKLDELPSQLDHASIVDQVMKTTGLPRETVEGMNLTDEELDDLCETVLSDLDALPPRAGFAKRWR